VDGAGVLEVRGGGQALDDSGLAGRGFNEVKSRVRERDRQREPRKARPGANVHYRGRLAKRSDLERGEAVANVNVHGPRGVAHRRMRIRFLREGHQKALELGCGTRGQLSLASDRLERFT
jgi:hypothetical protein